MARNFVFIDTGIADYQTLIAGLSADTAWALLDADRDGVTQMREALAGYSGLDSIQILSHGSAGTLYLGSTVLDQSSLNSDADALQEIGQSLTQNGDLLLYGCNVVQGENGARFIAALADATGADVAASTNLTGSQFKGGDWSLEARTGEVCAPAVAADNYNFTLSLTNNGTLSFSGDDQPIFGLGSLGGVWDILGYQSPELALPETALPGGGAVSLSGQFSAGLFPGIGAID